jgi:hypothetical protein
MLVRGLRGRRVGDEPRCPKCEYNLTGHASEACPECGAPTTRHRIVRGVRRRNVVMIVTGAAMTAAILSMIGIGAYSRAQRINWYPHLPFDWVLRDARSGSPVALTELTNRYTANSLTGEQVDAAITAALVEQAAARPVRTQQAWIDLAAVMHRAGDLNPAQSQTFLRQAAPMKLEARARIRSGDPLPFHIIADSRAPTAAGMYSFQMNVLAYVDERPIYDDAGNYSGHSVSGVNSGNRTHYFSTRTSGLTTGPRDLVVKFTHKLFVGGTTDPAADTADYELGAGLTAPFTVLPADAPDPVRLLPLSKLDPAADIADVRASVGVRDVTCQVFDDPDRPQVSVHVDLGGFFAKIPGGPATETRPSPPVAMAFEAFVATADGREHSLGYMAAPEGRNQSFGLGLTLPRFDDATVTVILRASADAARRSIDLYDVWDGTLTFKNVPVKRDPAAP